MRQPTGGVRLDDGKCRKPYRFLYTATRCGRSREPPAAAFLAYGGNVAHLPLGFATIWQTLDSLLALTFISGGCGSPRVSQRIRT